jgi:hypothetical protein
MPRRAASRASVVRNTVNAIESPLRPRFGGKNLRESSRAALCISAFFTDSVAIFA